MSSSKTSPMSWLLMAAGLRSVLPLYLLVAFVDLLPLLIQLRAIGNGKNRSTVVTSMFRIRNALCDIGIATERALEIKH